MYGVIDQGEVHFSGGLAPGALDAASSSGYSVLPYKTEGKPHVVLSTSQLQCPMTNKLIYSCSSLIAENQLLFDAIEGCTLSYRQW